MVAQTVAAKRHSYGSNRPQAKLTEDTAYEALKELNKGHTGSLIANNIGVDPSQISRLKTGKAWNHVREKYEKDKQRGDYE